MKKLFYTVLGSVVAVLALTGAGSVSETPARQSGRDSARFETAVEIIKKYETLHQPRHYPLVGYGHLVIRGEKFSRSRAMNEADAEALLRRDLLKNCAIFRKYGADSLLLGTLAYNVGMGTVLRSSIVRLLDEGNRDIRDIYISYNKYRGRNHKGLRQRRIEEFDALFIAEPDAKNIPDDSLSPISPTVKSPRTTTKA